MSSLNINNNFVKNMGCVDSADADIDKDNVEKYKLASKKDATFIV